MRTSHTPKRLVRWIIIPALVAGLLAEAVPAARADDPNAELEKAQNKLEYIRQQKETTKNALAQAYWQAEEAQLQLKQVEEDLAVANNQLAVLSNQLTLAEGELKQVEVDLETVKQRFLQRKDMLSKRLRALNEEGRVNYLAVLFGSTSFSDFISRFDMLGLVVKKDSQLFDLVRQDRKLLEQKQEEASQRRDRLATLKLQSEERRNVIRSRRDEQQQVSRSLEVNKRSLQARLNEFDAQEQAVIELVTEIQRRLARKGGKFAPIAPVRRPITITDPFGPRLHPILNTWRQHNGTDFAANYGDPVYAIEDGQVIVASWNDAYGNLIVIDHGNGISSWYGHSSKLLVRVNEIVKQGQKISEAGSTGWSTGPHVHLEIRVNGTAENPMSYLQP